MIKKRNWTISVILAGILFFTVIGYLLSIETVILTEYYKLIIVYWCLGISFASLLCLSLFKTKTYKDSKNRILERVLFFPVSLLLSGTLIDMEFYPIFIFVAFIVSWTIWAVIRNLNRSNNLEVLNILIISWLVLSITVSIGQFIGYSDDLISKIYALSIFLDLRITLTIIICSIILLMSLGRIDFSNIETKELLKIGDDKGNPFLIIVDLFFVLINFLIQIGWWFGSFIFLWGQEFVTALKKKTIETKDTLFDIFIILFCILGLYASSRLSEFILIEYLPLNNTIDEIIPFLKITFITCLIFLAAYMVIRFRHLSWNKWKPVLNKSDFISADKEYREAIAFPLLTSGIAGIVLFGLSKIPTLGLMYFQNFGTFSFLLSLGLLIAIIISVVKLFSKSAY